MPYAHTESIVHSCKVCLAEAVVRVVTRNGGKHGYFCHKHGSDEVETLNKMEAEYVALVKRATSSEHQS